MVDIARGYFQLKELTMTDEPALRILGTLRNQEEARVRWGFKRRDWKPSSLFQGQVPGYGWRNLFRFLCIDGNYIY
jgi:hypothetical protein